jgi:hypothetical protein
MKGEDQSGGREGGVNELKVKVTINVNVSPHPLFLPLLPPPSLLPSPNKNDERVGMIARKQA